MALSYLPGSPGFPMLLEMTARAGWLIEGKYYTSLILRSPGILISLPLRLAQGEELASSIDEKRRPGFGSQPSPGYLQYSTRPGRPDLRSASQFIKDLTVMCFALDPDP